MKSGLPLVTLPSGATVPALGLGTWRMGENARKRAQEADALRLGLDLGMTLIDTAEMYGEGRAEEIVAEAIVGRRDSVFLVSKVYPHNASRRGTLAACERSLRRLGVDCIDLYLLHWRGEIPLAETLEGFSRLGREGKIRHWGVSNFDVEDMEELFALPGGSLCATNQVLYNLHSRGVETGLLPWCRHHGVPLMAYSPIDQGRLARASAVRRIAERYGATPARIALAWLLQRNQVMVIPKASQPAHVRENRAALDITLSSEDLSQLDAAFPPPKRRGPLQML